jgi:hypothetical protein
LAVWLFYVDGFFLLTIGKGRFDIHLFDLEIQCGCNCEKHLIAHELHHGSEGLMVVDFFLLVKSPDDPTCLVADSIALAVSLSLVNPIALQDVAVLRKFHQSPCLVLVMGLPLILHGFLPVIPSRALLGLYESLRFWENAFPVF